MTKKINVKVFRVFNSSTERQDHTPFIDRFRFFGEKPDWYGSKD